MQNTLDLVYYPNIQGPYNNNPNFVGEQPEDKWAGIMRSLSSTNFEQSNIEFVQFWVLDPYVDGVATSPGELVINLGNISEDILKDGRKQSRFQVVLYELNYSFTLYSQANLFGHQNNPLKTLPKV